MRVGLEQAPSWSCLRLPTPAAHLGVCRRAWHPQPMTARVTAQVTLGSGDPGLRAVARLYGSSLERQGPVLSLGGCVVGHGPESRRLSVRLQPGVWPWSHSDCWVPCPLTRLRLYLSRVGVAGWDTLPHHLRGPSTSCCRAAGCSVPRVECRGLRHCSHA